MSYRIAELLGRGEEDESARAEITETVLKLWAHRWSWPDGWPPESARRQLTWLFGPGRGGHPQPNDSTSQFMRRVADALSDEYKFWLWAASATTDPDSEDAWGIANSYTPWAERQLIRRLNELTRLAAEVTGEDAAVGEAGTQPDRERLARDELNSLLRARRSLLPNALKLASAEPDVTEPTSGETSAL